MTNGEPPIALVTGGAIRVGAAIVRALAGAGYRVWVHCHRSVDAAHELVRELGAQVLGVVPADLADADDRQRLIDTLLSPTSASAGRLNLLVNSAASFEHGAFEKRSDADLQRVLATNLVAPISLARGLLPALRRTVADAPVVAPSIVNIVDLGGLAPWPEYLDHCTAKAGLVMATKALALEVAPTVRVNAIAPGTVLWPEGSTYEVGSPWREEVARSIPLRRCGSPQDVAAAVLFLAHAPYVTGHILHVDGGRSVAGGR